MKIYSRKEFLKASTLTLSALAIYKSDWDDFKKKPVLGLQLYSVREDMKLDPVKTLQSLAKMGYTHLEHAGYSNGLFYGFTPKSFKKILDDLGLKMFSGHGHLKSEHWNYSTKDFTEEWKRTIEDANTAGQEFIFNSWIDESIRNDPEKLLHLFDLYNRCGELCKRHGITFGYHNHDYEFTMKLRDQMLYTAILENTEPKLVAQQLDIGNMHGTSTKAVDLIKKYPGRFASMHIKDMIANKETGKPESTRIGKGVVPVKQILDLVKNDETIKSLIVEQEHYQGQAPIMAMKDNLASIKKLVN